jgi:hypothetical protein
MQSTTPLLAVLTGAAVTFVVSFYKDTVQWLRDKQTRLRDIRREAYADYARRMKLDMVTCKRMAAHLGMYESGATMSEKDALAQLTRLGDDRSVSFDNLLLVGSPKVVKAAREWHDAVLALRKWARDEPKPPASVFSKLYTEAGKARHGFYVKARDDLGVKGVVSHPIADETWTAEE